jgi:hypothetical protein
MAASAGEVCGRVEGLGSEQTLSRPVIPYREIKLAIKDLLTQMAKNLLDCRVVILIRGLARSMEEKAVFYGNWRPGSSAASVRCPDRAGYP